MFQRSIDTIWIKNDKDVWGVYVIRCFQCCTWLDSFPFEFTAMSIVKQGSSNQGQIRAYTMNLGLKHLDMDWLLAMYVSEKQMIQMFPFHDFRNVRNLRKVYTWSKVVQLTRISQSATAFPATLDQQLDCTIRNFFAKKTCNYDYIRLIWIKRSFYNP